MQDNIEALYNEQIQSQVNMNIIDKHLRIINYNIHNIVSVDSNDYLHRKSDGQQGCETFGTGHTYTILKQAGKRHSLKLRLKREEMA